ncbi:hypothetical protein [Amphritea sp. HPY]|uniref:hypothetical protein n=1 Tax=Amphritea sp. HPY TaxID=3421652 RepID=UPI003D7F1036
MRGEWHGAFKKAFEGPDNRVFLARFDTRGGFAGGNFLFLAVETLKEMAVARFDVIADHKEREVNRFTADQIEIVQGIAALDTYASSGKAPIYRRPERRMCVKRAIECWASD